MCQETKSIDWEEVENGMVMQWYYVQKIMGQMIPGYYPYITFQGLVECINNDPNFKQGEEE